MKPSQEYSRPNRATRILQKLGLMNKSNLFWSFYEPRNFGDWIGPYLFEAFTKKIPFYYPPKLAGRSIGLFTAGSILRQIKIKDTAIVWGSGIISSDDNFERPISVLALRGPRSRDHLHRLGYPTTDIFGDPGILMPSVYTPEIAKRARVGIIPHFTDYDDVRAAFSSVPEIKIINVCQNVEKVVDDILSCEATVSSSLHGIIISQSYGLPCAWIASWETLDGDGQKFQDYFEAGGVKVPEPRLLKPEMNLHQIESLALGAAVPDIQSLAAPLMEACPFKV